MREEQEWMCLFRFQKFAFLAKVKSSKLAWSSYHFKNDYFDINLSMACISHFCFMKIKLISRFYFTVSLGQSKFCRFYKKPVKLIHEEFNQTRWHSYSLSLPHFIILLALKYHLMFFDFNTLRRRCNFVFC